MKRSIARGLLKLLGWTVEGKRPTHSQFVLIAAPHTSNWDFPLMILCAAAFDVRIRWMGKQSLFHFPYGWIMRALGGLPIERERSNAVVDSMVARFREGLPLVLVVPAEGTRARVDFWKSGFYHIALGAAVPIVPSYLDWGARRAGFAEPMLPTGDMTRDMDYLRAIYEPMGGRFPALFGPVRLREENAESAPGSEQQPRRAAGDSG